MGTATEFKQSSSVRLLPVSVVEVRFGLRVSTIVEVEFKFCGANVGERNSTKIEVLHN